MIPLLPPNFLFNKIDVTINKHTRIITMIIIKTVFDESWVASSVESFDEVDLFVFSFVLVVIVVAVVVVVVVVVVLMVVVVVVLVGVCVAVELLFVVDVSMFLQSNNIGHICCLVRYV